MNIDRINVKKIMLRESHDLTELRKVPSQNAIPRHPLKWNRKVVWGLQEFNKQSPIGVVCPKFVVNQIAGFAKLANSFCSNTFDTPIAGENDKCFQQSRGKIFKCRRRRCFKLVSAKLKSRVDNFDLCVVHAKNRFFRQLV